MKPWLSVIGIGEDGLEGLAPAARQLIYTAEVLAGGTRHLAMIPPSRAKRITWGKLHADLDRIEKLRSKRVVVLASGDPMWFGIGATLAKSFSATELNIVPHPGAFSLAAARLTWPLAEVSCLSVHGRPLEAVALHIYSGARLLVLANDGSSAADLVALLRDRGYGKSRVTVLERLGGEKEKVRTGIAARWGRTKTDALSVIAIEAITDDPAQTNSRAPGLPSTAFEHDGQITQPEARAAALAALAPWSGALLWDVGAGSGSIGIEWMRAGGRAIAIERVAARRARIAHNALTLGVPGLEIVAGTAPAALKGLPKPDAIFIGGGTSNPSILDAAWKALGKCGRLVAHAVTAEGEAELVRFQARHGGELTRIAISRLAAVGRFRRWHPEAPVTQYKVSKR